VRLRRRQPDAGRLGAYGGDRPEVRALVPPGARRVLDLGCSMGSLGAALKRDRDVEVVGVELDPAFAAQAEARLDRVLAGDVESVLADSGDELGRFDCVLAVDLLEPGGTAVVSLPNVRFFETFWQLGVRGTWPRRDRGIFDRTHLRWFTLRDARELLERAGLEVTEVQLLIRIRPVGSRFDPLFAWLGRTPAREFLAFQFVLAGVRRR
jgi:predicted RNA methylase